MSTAAENRASKSATANFFSDIGLGSLSAAISKTAVAPIERGKLLMQTQNVNFKVKEGDHYKGLLDVFYKVSKNEGVLALWRGNLVNVIRYMPTQALMFAFHGIYKPYLCSFDPKTDFWKFTIGNVVASSAAGATSLVFVYPLDFARTRLGTDIGRGSERQFTGLFDCFNRILKTDGIRGLYKGFETYLLVITIYRGISFGGYNIFKNTILTSDSSFLAKFLVAQATTTFAGCAIYPLDTIARRLMMQAGRDDVLYFGPIDCYKKILEKEGWRAFYKGGWINVIRGIGASLVLVMYDELYKLFFLNDKAASKIK